MNKTFAEMTNSELFGVLAGNQGVMAQMLLRRIIRSCRERGVEGDLAEMVRSYLREGQVA